MRDKNNKVVQPLRDCPEILEKAAIWFSEKWEVPVEAYRASMEDALLKDAGIPQWYLVLGDQGEIIAGAGIIENDFHKRKDLRPNLCALFVEEDYRHQGIGRSILDFARRDAKTFGVDKLYLVTDHQAFYEKCDWTFLTMVDGEAGTLERMYMASTSNNCSSGDLADDKN